MEDKFKAMPLSMLEKLVAVATKVLIDRKNAIACATPIEKLPDARW